MSNIDLSFLESLCCLMKAWYEVQGGGAIEGIPSEARLYECIYYCSTFNCGKFLERVYIYLG